MLEDLEVDPDPFGRALGVSGVGAGSFRLVVAPGSVAEVLGVPARVVEGRLVVGPDREPAKVRLDRGELVIESPYLQREGIDHRLAVVDRRLLPCEPEVALLGDAVELRCTGDRLPGILDVPLGEPVGDVPAPTELEPSVTVERTAPTTTAAPTTTTDAVAEVRAGGGDDEARLAEYAELLADGVDAALADWTVRVVRERWPARAGPSTTRWHRAPGRPGRSAATRSAHGSGRC